MCDPPYRVIIHGLAMNIRIFSVDSMSSIRCGYQLHERAVVASPADFHFVQCRLSERGRIAGRHWSTVRCRNRIREQQEYADGNPLLAWLLLRYLIHAAESHLDLRQWSTVARYQDCTL